METSWESVPPFFFLGPSGALIGPRVRVRIRVWVGVGVRARVRARVRVLDRTERSLDDVVIDDRLVQVARKAVARRHAYGILLAWRESGGKDGRALLGREEREEPIDDARVARRRGELGRPRQRGLVAADAGNRTRAARLLCGGGARRQPSIRAAPLAQH